MVVNHWSHVATLMPFCFTLLMD